VIFAALGEIAFAGLSFDISDLFCWEGCFQIRVKYFKGILASGELPES